MNQETQKTSNSSRTAVITRTSLIGILVNALLATTKVVIGSITHSIAISLDGINNLSDAGSSIITMISAKLANKPADKKHPLGYGRTEYLSTLVIAVIILYAGISSLFESIDKIREGGVPSYTSLSLWILLFAVLVKVALGLYTLKEGKKVDSGSLEASGKDALNDSIMSASVLISALIFQFTGISLEAWVGLVIALFIIKSGYEIIRDSISEILGERIDPELSHDIKKEIQSTPGILGAYDLILNDYGPERTYASVHIEVPEDWNANQIDKVSRKIEEKVYKKFHIVLTGIGVYATRLSDPVTQQIKEKIRHILKKHPSVIQMHGLYVTQDPKEIRFDIVLDFDSKDRTKEYHEILKECQEIFPDYTVTITPDADLSD